MEKLQSRMAWFIRRQWVIWVLTHLLLVAFSVYPWLTLPLSLLAAVNDAVGLAVNVTMACARRRQAEWTLERSFLTYVLSSVFYAGFLVCSLVALFRM